MINQPTPMEPLSPEFLLRIMSLLPSPLLCLPRIMSPALCPAQSPAIVTANPLYPSRHILWGSYLYNLHIGSFFVLNQICRVQPELEMLDFHVSEEIQHSPQ